MISQADTVPSHDIITVATRKAENRYRQQVGYLNLRSCCTEVSDTRSTNITWHPVFTQIFACFILFRSCCWGFSATRGRLLSAVLFCLFLDLIDWLVVTFTDSINSFQVFGKILLLSSTHLLSYRHRLFRLWFMSTCQSCFPFLSFWSYLLSKLPCYKCQFAIIQSVLV